MRKLVKSLILGLLMTIIVAIENTLCVLPSLFLLKSGLVSNKIGQLEKSFMGALPAASTQSYIVMAIQIFLNVLTIASLFIFLSKVTKAHLPNEEYFCSLYNGIFLTALLVPEILAILMLFTKIPVMICLYIIIGFLGLLFTITTIMAVKVLPESVKVEKSKYLFSGEK